MPGRIASRVLSLSVLSAFLLAGCADNPDSMADVKPGSQDSDGSAIDETESGDEDTEASPEVEEEIESGTCVVEVTTHPFGAPGTAFDTQVIQGDRCDFSEASTNLDEFQSAFIEVEWDNPPPTLTVNGLRIETDAECPDESQNRCPVAWSNGTSSPLMLEIAPELYDSIKDSTPHVRLSLDGEAYEYEFRITVSLSNKDSFPESYSTS